MRQYFVTRKAQATEERDCILMMLGEINGIIHECDLSLAELDKQSAPPSETAAPSSDPA